MKPKTKTIIFRTSGLASTLHSELFPLEEIGEINITRWSNIKFNNETKLWEVTLKKEPNHVIYMHSSREKCIDWEHELWERQ